MTREEAIIEAGIEYSIQNSPYCIGGDNFYEKARELNRNKSFEAGVIWADKNPKSPWISVEDDLPCNHSDLVLTYNGTPFSTKRVLVMTDIRTLFLCEMKKDDACGWIWNISTKDKITHWTPIPEPPIGGNRRTSGINNN